MEEIPKFYVVIQGVTGQPTHRLDTRYQGGGNTEIIFLFKVL
jgi:hypothetical protein